MNVELSSACSRSVDKTCRVMSNPGSVDALSIQLSRQEVYRREPRGHQRWRAGLRVLWRDLLDVAFAARRLRPARLLYWISAHWGAGWRFAACNGRSGGFLADDFTVETIGDSFTLPLHEAVSRSLGLFPDSTCGQWHMRALIRYLP